MEKVRANAFKTEKKINFYRANQDLYQVDRVLLMPIEFSDEYTDSLRRQLDDNLFLELSRKKYFEVIRLDELSSEFRDTMVLNEGANSFRRLDQEQLATLHEDMSIDGVIYPYITHLRAFRPLSLSFKHVMFHTKQEGVVWSVDDNFDMSNPDVALLTKKWYFSKHGKDANPSLGAEIIEISVNKFSQFVFSQFSNTWEGLAETNG